MEKLEGCEENERVCVCERERLCKDSVMPSEEGRWPYNCVSVRLYLNKTSTTLLYRYYYVANEV